MRNADSEIIKWLRGHAQRLTKREHVNQPFPEGGMYLDWLDHTGLTGIVFDLEEAAESERKLLFTLADIDEL